MKYCLKIVSDTLFPNGKRCIDQNLDDIQSEIKCKEEGHLRGLQWGGILDEISTEANYFPACFFDHDERYKVYFNKNPDPGNTVLNPNYFALCQAHSRGKIS